MVLYDFKCPVCGELFEAFAVPHIETALCPYCGIEARRVWINAPAVNAPGEYYDIGLDSVITSP